MNSLLTLYKHAVVVASKALLKNLIIIPASLLLYVLFIFAGQLFSPLGLAGGFILGFLQVAALSLYYSWIAAIREQQKLTMSDLIQFDWSFFMPTIGAAFILSLGDLLFRQSFQASPSLQWITAIYGFIIFFTLNCIPEVVHTLKYDGIIAFQKSFSFIKEHWIEWFIPLIIIMAPTISKNGQSVLLLMAGTDVLFPITLVMKSLAIGMEITSLVSLVAILAFGTWYMVFRAFLFEILERGGVSKIKTASPQWYH